MKSTDPIVEDLGDREREDLEMDADAPSRDAAESIEAEPAEPADAEAAHAEAADTEAIESAEADLLTAEQRLQAQIDDLKDQLLRRSAEMENMRKRLQRERVQLFEQARTTAIESFLPVNDDLLRTVEALRNAHADPTFLEGVRMVSEKFDSILKSYGVETISESGVPFDVHLHEALMRQKAPAPDMAPDTVLQVLENGYRLGDRVIRHAKVIVSE